MKRGSHHIIFESVENFMNTITLGLDRNRGNTFLMYSNILRHNTEDRLSYSQFNIDVYINKNSKRVSTRKVLGIFKLNQIISIVNQCKDGLGNIFLDKENAKRKEPPYKLEQWQYEVLAKRYNDKNIQNDDSRLNIILLGCLNFISSFNTAIEAYLNKADGPPEDYFISFESYQHDNSYFSVEDFACNHPYFNKRYDKGVILFFEENSTSYKKFGESLIGMPELKSDEIEIIEKNIELGIEHFGIVRFKTEDGNVVSIWTEDIRDTIDPEMHEILGKDIET